MFAYTGDTGPCEAAVALGLDADLFLARRRIRTPRSSTRSICRRRRQARSPPPSGADHLVLTHLTPDLDQRISIKEAAETFTGPIDIAVPGMVLEVGR